MNKEVGILLPKKELIQVEQGKVIIIGASLSEPHTFRTAMQNPPYINILVHSTVVQFGPTKGPFKRATRKRRTSQ